MLTMRCGGYLAQEWCERKWGKGLQTCHHQLEPVQWSLTVHFPQEEKSTQENISQTNSVSGMKETQPPLHAKPPWIPHGRSRDIYGRTLSVDRPLYLSLWTSSQCPLCAKSPFPFLLSTSSPPSSSQPPPRILLLLLLSMSIVY